MTYLYKTNKLIQHILSENIDSEYWLKESITGEYWYADGRLIYCDGDICDTNHERVVIEHILSVHDLIDYVESYGINEITGILYEREHLQTDEEIQEYSHDYNMDIEVIKDILEKSSNITKDELSYLGGNKDPREYGLKYLGWIRIKKNDFETYAMNNEQLDNILDAINEISEVEGYEELDEQDSTINIEVIETRQYYTNIPISVIQDKNIAALQLYK